MRGRWRWRVLAFDAPGASFSEELRPWNCVRSSWTKLLHHEDQIPTTGADTFGAPPNPSDSSHLE